MFIACMSGKSNYALLAAKKKSSCLLQEEEEPHNILVATSIRLIYVVAYHHPFSYSLIVSLERGTKIEQKGSHFHRHSLNFCACFKAILCTAAFYGVFCLKQEASEINPCHRIFRRMPNPSSTSKHSFLLSLFHFSLSPSSQLSPREIVVF